MPNSEPLIRSLQKGEAYFLDDTVEIIVTGNEILSGQTRDTNSSYLARELLSLGLNCRYISTVGDNPQDLLELAERAFSRSELVISTGGLGPTEDDLTMRLMSEAAGLKLYEDANCIKEIVGYFKKMGRECSSNNFKQALIPEGGIVLNNNLGTACGVFVPFSFKGKKRYFACLPGPPAELKSMFVNSLRSILQARIHHHFNRHVFRVFGIGESNLETLILDLIKKENGIYVATYASAFSVQVVLSEYRDDSEECNNVDFVSIINQVRKRLGNFIYSENNLTLPQVVLQLLKENNITVAFAESCTSGLLSAKLGEIAGASAVFLGAIISYSNQVKRDQLQVSTQLLDAFGPVSKEVALKMAEGARERFHSDIAVSVTGLAGPDGGTESLPVGTVWLGISTKDGTKAFKFSFTGPRRTIQLRATMKAFDLIRRYVLYFPLIEETPKL